MHLGRPRHEPRDENMPCDQVDAAIREDRAALAAAGRRPERRIAALGNLATSLYCAYRCQARPDQPGQLLEAIEHLTEARELAAADAARYGGSAQGLAAAEAVRDIEHNISVFRSYLPSTSASGQAAVSGGESAREQLERAYARPGAGVEERASAVLQLGTLDHNDWETSSREELLARAIERCREAVRLLAASPDGRLLLVARSNLLNALMSWVTRVGTSVEEYLTEAHRIIEELDASGQGDSVPGYAAVRSHVLSQFALVNHHRTRDRGGLAQAEERLRRLSADRGPLHGLIGDHTRSVEAMLAGIRLRRDGRLQAGDEAVDILRGDGEASTHPVHLLNGSFALFHRHQERAGVGDGVSQDLYDALALASLAAERGEGAVRANALRMSAHCLLDLARYEPQSAETLFERALEAITEAIGGGTFNEREVLLAGATEAQCRTGLAAVRRDPTGLEAAAAQLALLSAQLPDANANRPTMLAELFGVRLAKAEITGAPDDEARATEAAKQACEAAAEFSPAVEYSTAQAWGDWAWRRGALLEAAEAYRHGLSALHHLSRVQVTRGDKTSVLSRAEGMGARAAYAFAEAGMLGRAVVAVESGRALMLTEALERRAADLDRLRQTGRSDLADAFGAAAAEVARTDAELLGGPGTWPEAGTGTDATRAARVRDRFDTVVAEIRESAGLASFLPPPSYGELARTVRESGTHTVYLLATDRGGLALSLPATENARPLRIPLSALTASVRDRLVADWQDALDLPDEEEALREERCDAVADRLWTDVMAPVLRRLRGVPKVALVAVGGLGLLPLHAARRPDATAPTGHRHVIDDLAVSYQANVRALGVARTIRSRTGPHQTLLTVQEPATVSADHPPLPSATWQVQLARQHFRRGTGASLSGSEATREAVLAALPLASVQHFACHGTVVDGSPLDGGLVMSGDEVLTVRDVLTLAPRDARMAVLPACRSGALDRTVLDEAAGMPSAFLQGGYAGVMATGWNADGWVCAQITDRFYAHWLGEEMEPEQALRQAQIRVRDSTNAQKHAAYPQLDDLKPRPGEETGPWASARQDTSTYYWAVLSFHGC